MFGRFIKTLGTYWNLYLWHMTVWDDTYEKKKPDSYWRYSLTLGMGYE
jgi:hypothetical protein